MLKSLTIITLLQVLAAACDSDLQLTVVNNPPVSEQVCLSQPEMNRCREYMESLGKDRAFKLAEIRPLNSLEGQVVHLKGASFDEQLQLTIEGRDIPLFKTSDTEAFFLTPGFANPGLKTAVLKRLERSQEFNIYIIADTSINPSWLSEASQLCEGSEFMRGDGSLALGTKPCANTVSAVNCIADGQLGCLTTAAFSAADTSTAANKIVAGQSLAGVQGTFITPAASKVLTGTAYGVAGMGSTGTLTLPAASHVLSSAGAYGDAGPPAHQP